MSSYKLSKNDKEDVDDFIRKADAVDAAIRAMKDGTLNPEDVKIDGIDTPEEIKRKEEEKELKRLEKIEKDIALKKKRKQEEKEKWWNGADLFRDKIVDNSASNSEAEDLMEIKKQKYTADYSRWEQWVPNDETSIAERQELIDAEEKVKNAEFEANNAEFCANFKKDMNDRTKAMEKKTENSDICRLKGNRCFKMKDFAGAFDHYMESLKIMPYDKKTLMNVAQVHIKLKAYEDAMEFISRSLYLNPKNVKALSRQAFIHGERGNYTDAAASCKKALALEPSNAEIIEQMNEIVQITKEKEEEEQVNSSRKPAPTVVASAATTSGTNSAAGEEKSPSLYDNNSNYEALDVVKSHLDSWVKLDCNPSQLHLFADLQKEIGRCVISVTGDKNMRIYFRSSNTIGVVIQAAQILFPTVNEGGGTIDATCRIVFDLLLLLLQAGSRGERASIMSLHSEGLISSVVQLVTTKTVDELMQLGTSGSSEDEECLKITERNTLQHGIDILYMACTDDLCGKKIRAVVYGQMTVWSHLSTMLFAFSARSSASSSPPDSSHTLILSVLSLLKDMTFSVEGKKAIDSSGSSRSDLSDLVLGLGMSLAADTSSSSSTADVNKMTCTIETLLGCSQTETFRSVFVAPIPQMEKTEELSVISVIIKAIKAHPDALMTNGLAILMNVCIDDKVGGEGDVRQVIYDAGGYDIAVRGLLPDGAVDSFPSEDSFDVVERIRQLGLLSRLCVLPCVPLLLADPHVYQRIVHTLRYSTLLHVSDGSAATTEGDNLVMGPNSKLTLKNKQDIQGHLVRTLAAALAHQLTQMTDVSASGKKKWAELDKQYTAIASADHVLYSLLTVFPSPREELGEITPASVTLTPLNHKDTNVLLLGNAARCLMQLVDLSPTVLAPHLFLRHSPAILAASKAQTNAVSVRQGRVNVSIEKFICAIASCTDIRVRKNIAILLAKGMKLVPEIKDHVVKFRGMQMIVELQSKLIG